MTIPDPRLNAFREDLADARLERTVRALRYVEGRPARISLGLARVLAHGEPGAPIQTQFRFGEPLLIFDEQGGYVWCQSGEDGYVGYVEASCVCYEPPAGELAWVQGMGTFRYPEPDLRLRPIDFIPRAAALRLEPSFVSTRGVAYRQLQDGGFVVTGSLAAERPFRTSIVEAAMCYIGTPYLWGGKSFIGLDCSGLVQVCCEDVGIEAPRDSDLQRDTVGLPIEISDISGIKDGQLLFAPGHVGIVGREQRVIHANGKTMTVEAQPILEFMRERELDLKAIHLRRVGETSRALMI